MKKSLLHFAYVGAIALVGSVCFSACSDDVSKELETNPVNGGQKVDFTDVVGVSDVPVDFMFNVSTKTGADTRMSAATVQASVGTTPATFRGINHGILVAYKVPNTGDWITPATVVPANMLKVYPEFASLISPSTSSESYASTRILELSMPSTTNALLFYGAAPNSGNYNEHGKTNLNLNDPSGNINKLVFSYQKRISDNGFVMFKKVGKMIAGILTGLMDMGFKESSLATADRDFYFWWPEGNGNSYDNDEALAEIIGWDDDDYIKIYGSPKRPSDHRTDNVDGTPNLEYRAKNFTKDVLEGSGELAESLPNTKTVDGVKKTLYHSNVTWKAYGLWAKKEDTSTYPDFDGANEAALSELGEKLGFAYNAMKKTQTKELRAASSEAILTLIKDLWDVVNSVAEADPTGKKEFVAFQFAKRLRSRIWIYFNCSVGNPATWKSINDFKTELTNYANAANNPLDLTGITDTYITQFPTGAAYGIPPGGSLVDFTYDYGDDPNAANYGTSASPTWKGNYKDSGGLFKFLEYIPNYDLGGNGQSSVTVENYTYPAELMYFGNSPIRVSDKELTSAAYPTTAATWGTSDLWAAKDTENKDIWTNGSVTSSTHSVAMKNNVNYGVAMLETKVRYGVNTLEDNNGNLTDHAEANKQISVANNPFQLTGIIIGQQPRGVGWDFTSATVPTEGTDAMDMAAVSNSSLVNWDRLVYDKLSTPVTITKADNPDVASYTLLLDNYMNGDVQTVQTTNTPSIDANQQQIVYVALEFKNNGDSFMGQHNMVRKNGTFYIIGAIDPKNKTIMNGETPVTNRTDHALPPYTDGTHLNWTPRVFMQDYKTSVTFTIGQYSLQYAYVTLPNLKASQVSLGLSVDITWENGLDFGSVTLGGDTQLPAPNP